MYGIYEDKMCDEIAYIKEGFDLAKRGFVILEMTTRSIVFVNNETGEEKELIVPRDRK